MARFILFGLDSIQEIFVVIFEVCFLGVQMGYQIFFSDFLKFNYAKNKFIVIILKLDNTPSILDYF